MPEVLAQMKLEGVLTVVVIPHLLEPALRPTWAMKKRRGRNSPCIRPRKMFVSQSPLSFPPLPPFPSAPPPQATGSNTWVATSAAKPTSAISFPHSKRRISLFVFYSLGSLEMQYRFARGRSENRLFTPRVPHPTHAEGVDPKTTVRETSTSRA